MQAPQAVGWPAGYCLGAMKTSADLLLAGSSFFRGDARLRCHTPPQVSRPGPWRTRDVGTRLTVALLAVFVLLGAPAASAADHASEGAPAAAAVAAAAWNNLAAASAGLTAVGTPAAGRSGGGGGAVARGGGVGGAALDARRLVGGEYSGGEEAQHGASHGEGHDHQWWDENYEYKYVESYVLVVLVLMAIIFEKVHHTAEHFVEGTYQFGQPTAHQVGHHHRRHQTVPLFKSLFIRASGEFMVLGFLAFVVWLFNQAGFFEEVAHSLDQHHTIKLPVTAGALLHTVENVHMQLFIAMIIFFLFLGVALRFTLMLEARFEKANLRILGLLKDGTSCEVWLRQQNHVTNIFYHYREWFFSSLAAWSGRWDLADEVLKKLIPRVKEIYDAEDVDEADEEKEPNVPVLLRTWFPFDTYLALNCRFVIDCLIEFHVTTWVFIMVIYIIQAQIHRDAKANLDMSSPFWIAVCFLCLVLASVWVAVHARSVAKNDVDQDVRSACASCPMFHHLHPAQCFVRVVQVCCFFTCYEVAHVIGDSHMWKQYPMLTTTYAVFLVIGLLPAGIWLGVVLPAFVCVVATGAFMQDHHLFRLAVIIDEYSRNGKSGTFSSKTFCDDWNTVDSRAEDLIARISKKNVRSKTHEDAASSSEEESTQAAEHPHVPHAAN